MEIAHLLLANRYKQSAVMLCLWEKEGEDYLIFEKRAKGIRQGGEISFPGGKRDCLDRSFKETAIRETMEELGLERSQIRYIDYVGTLVGELGVLLDVHLCRLNIKSLEEVYYNPSEVEYLISIPLRYFLEEKAQKRKAEIQNIPDFNPKEYGLPERYWKKWPFFERELYFYFYEKEVIWGLTAQILVAWIEEYLQKEDRKYDIR